ncbi:MAG TPA: DnaJ domain-containing protein, partial [Candidatus Limnocylindrales bacterium]|nr:DnaJ domain-containing protein [Candidatus Limnocylindrales bacterium]
MTSERDAYEVLQVNRAAAWPEIRAAYRTLVRRYHPDCPTPNTTRMKEINAAYERVEREHRHGRDGSPGV